MLFSNLFLRSSFLLTVSVLKPINSQGIITGGLAMKNYICDFEVFGIVQGVFFRKHTQKTAKSLGVRGWCMNTRDDTVKGQLEGEEQNIKEMQNWLRNKGSPQSRIDKVVFSDLTELSETKYHDFSIKS